MVVCFLEGRLNLRYNPRIKKSFSGKAELFCIFVSLLVHIFVLVAIFIDSRMV